MDDWIKNELLWKIQDTASQEDIEVLKAIPPCADGRLVGFEDVKKKEKKTSEYQEFMKQCLKDKKGKNRMKECAEEYRSKK